MTQTDPWAAASAKATGAAGDNGGGSSLGDSYSGKPSQLFSTTEGAGPSLFNKTHPVGTERTGIIAKAPYDRHSTNMKGELKYWQNGEKQPVTNAIDPRTGEANRKVTDTVIVLDTEYQMDATEAAALGRDTPFEGGRRSVTLSGENLKLVKEAIGDAIARGIKITSDQDLVGLRWMEKRVTTKQNPHGGDPIKIHAYRIEKP